MRLSGERIVPVNNLGKCPLPVVFPWVSAYRRYRDQPNKGSDDGDSSSQACVTAVHERDVAHFPRAVAARVTRPFLGRWLRSCCYRLSVLQDSLNALHYRDSPREVEVLGSDCDQVTPRSGSALP